MAREVTLPADRQARVLLYVTAALLAIRGVMSAVLPPAFDETYYWLWSRHLAWSYLDHPPMVAYAIHAGTFVFGDTLAGLRSVSWILSVVSSVFVWRAAEILTGDARTAARAVLYFNLTLMVSVQAFAATPDAPAIAASSLLLYAVARLRKSCDPVWWWVVGLAGGLGLLSKYTALFLGAGVLAWLLIGDGKKWRASVHPYGAALLALLMFLPVVLWNAEHGWISFEKQFGRAGAGAFTLKYLGEFLAGQLGLATPFIAILGVAGLAAAFRSGHRHRMSAILLLCLIAPAMIYFLFHSFHARVQGNWPSFLYPAFAVAASYPDTRGRVLSFVRRSAAPFAAGLLFVVYLHAITGIVPFGPRDPLARLTAIGFAPVAEKLRELRSRENASLILTTSYAPTGWFAFYLPDVSVIQITERERYLAEPVPAQELFQSNLLYVTETWRDRADVLRARFARVEKIDEIARERNGVVFETYAVYLVSEPIAPVLGD